MSENIQLNRGTGGDLLAADDINNVKYQRLKLIHGVDGINDGDVSKFNPLPVKISSDTVFGEVLVSEDTPVVQSEFIYGINGRTFATVVTGSGTATSSSGLALCSTTAATNSSATVKTKRFLRYRSGQGAKARFTAMFTTGVANSQQEAGMGTNEQGFLIGYQGASFGIFRRKNSSDMFIPQASFNMDTLDGNGPSGMTIDPTKLNVYQIRYQYLGAGGIEYYVEEPISSRMILFHTIQYAGANTSPHIGNPSLPLRLHAANTSNNTNIVVSGASVYLALEGKRVPVGPQWSTAYTKANVSTLTNLFTLKTASSFNGVSSLVMVDIESITYGSCDNSANTMGLLHVIKDATLGGTPSFVPKSGSTSDNGTTITNGDSVISVDVAGTTVSGGSEIFSGVVNGQGAQSIDVSALGLYMLPGETLTFAMSATATLTAVGVGASWVEGI